MPGDTLDGLTWGFNFPTGTAHQLSLYVLDPDGNGPDLTFKGLDSAHHQLSDDYLTTLAHGSYRTGVYVKFRLTGHVIIKVQAAGTFGARYPTVMGYFLDPLPTETHSVAVLGNAQVVPDGGCDARCRLWHRLRISGSWSLP